MKNLRKILLFTVLMLTFGLTLSACTGNKGPITLQKPVANVQVRSNVISIFTPSNPNAKGGYLFGIYTGPNPTNLELYLKQTSNTNVLDVTKFIKEPQVYYFYVQLMGNEDKYITSVPSDRVSYDNSQALVAPQLHLNDKVLSWTGVPYSIGYEIYRNGNYMYTTTGTSFDITNYMPNMIAYNFEVLAKGAIGEWKNSAKSNTVSYTEHLKLESPQSLRIDSSSGEDLFRWANVTNSSGYKVLIDNTQEITVTSSYLALNSETLTLGKKYSLKVKALPKVGLIESDYSEAISYDNYITLNKPEILSVKRNGQDVLVEWEAVDSATSYTLLVNNVPYKDNFGNTMIIIETQVIVDGTLEDEEGGFEFKVYANSEGYYLEGPVSEAYYYIGIDTLEIPQNIELYYNEANNLMVSWAPVENTNIYEFAINETLYKVSQTQVNLSEYMEPDQVAQFRVRSIGYGFVLDSDFSQYEYANNNFRSNMSEYAQKYFYYNDFYDYHINSQEKFNALIGYIILHQKTLDTAFINYNLTPEQLDLADKLQGSGDNNGNASSKEVINYKFYVAVQSYTETYSLRYYWPEQILNNVYEFSFEFDTSINPSLSSNPEENPEQNDKFTPYKSLVGRSPDYNDFISDKSLVKIPVYNTNQLFMVVNSGAAPMFTEENGVAEQVYEMAKNVLREIIDDSMTDYQKVRAIFDWLSYSTVYDSYVYDLVAQSGSSINVAEYKSFYLEGVFIDGMAVCDGVAKTFALLANMEGITAIKINGLATTSGVTLGHAWNKVFISLEEGSPQEWYIIEATWSIASPGPDSKEILTHNYFMLTDEQMEEYYLPQSVFNPEANTPFDYFTQTYYESGKDYYIENQAELNHIIAHYLDADKVGMEFVVDSDFTFNYSKVNTALTAAGYLPGEVTFAVVSYNNLKGQQVTLISFDINTSL